MNRCEGLIKTYSTDLAEWAAVASKLEQISDAVASAPEFDAEKVKAVRKALARGAYEIDARRIARKLVNLDKALHREH